MSKFLRLTLKQKLLGGFLLCAVFTGLSGGAGILSLKQIQGKMGVTTKDITSTIEHQNAQTRKIALLRSLVDLITTADSKASLDSARQRHGKQFQSSEAGDTEKEGPAANTDPSGATKDLNIAVNKLIGHQGNYLTASDRLAELQKSTYFELDAVTKLSEKLAAEIEKHAETMINEALSGASEQMEAALMVTESAVDNIKAAIMVPTLSHAINSKVKDAVLTKTSEEMDVIKKQIDGLLNSIKTLISKLTRDDSTVAMEKLLQKMIGDFEFMVVGKSNQIALGYGIGTGEFENLLSVAKDCNDAMGEMAKLANEKANNVEFKASESMGDVMEGISSGFDEIEKATKSVIAQIKASIEVEAGSNKVNSLAKDVLLAAGPKAVDATLKQMMTTMEENNKRVSGLPQDSETVASIKVSLEKLTPLLKKMAGAKKQMIEARENLGKATAAIYAEVSEQEGWMLVAAQEMKSKAQAAMEASNSMVNKWQYALLFLGLLAFVLAVFVGIFVSGSVTKPVAKAVSFAEKMSEGDFTQTLDIRRKDEIGVLAGALNTMVSNLGGMFKEFATGVESIDASSKELSNIANHMSDGANNTSSKSNTVSSAAEEMNSNMNSVAATMEETATNVNMVAASAEQMTASITEIAHNTEKARVIAGEAKNESDEASNKINELGHAAKEIGKITETITEISEQTNLLALNATIEAARAGEAGKGFAVVANEIKELARQTAEATGEIKKQIDGVQGSTEGTVRRMAAITKVINQVNDIVGTIATAVEEQSVTTKEIAGNVVQASQGIQDSTESISHTNTVSIEITKDIVEVNQAAGEIVNSSSQVNMSAQELSGLADQLKGMVGQFKV